ncbi:MAG: epimerase [bacterium]|nr:epimerase [bacterium]
MKKTRVILTGATGMVGEGVLHECLLHADVEAVLVITRKAIATQHAKLKVVVHEDFYDFSTIAEQLTGYDSCLFCLGVSSVGMKEKDYAHVTYDLTMALARVLASVNADLTFCYISGAATDSSEKGRSMWARVKGKTENDLLNLFKNGYMFRPGYMSPTKGLNNILKYYNYVDWMYPGLRLLFPNFVSTLRELGLAMINSALKGYDKRVLEVKDIVKLAGKKTQ